MKLMGISAMNYSKSWALIKLVCTFWGLCISFIASSQTAENLPFLNQVYAINCNTPPHDIIYFMVSDKQNIFSLYPEQTKMLSGSDWGFFYKQSGEVFQFQKNGYIESRAVWVRGSQLALVFSDGSFRQNQKFYNLCSSDSVAFRFTKNTGNLNLAYEKFNKQESDMRRSEKFSKCFAYSIARQTCASAGSFENCMSVRWGKDWNGKETECY